MHSTLAAQVIANTQIALGIYELQLAAQGDISVAPGQFVHIQIPGDDARILRRPISVSRCRGNALILAYQVVGEGTRHLSQVLPGAVLDILGVLGNGFSVDARVKKAALLGGGIGAAPLVELAAANAQVSFDIFLGYRSAAHVYYADTFAGLGRTFLHTDDGSAGRQGYAVEGLIGALEREEYDAIYACGPTAMLRSLQSAISGRGIPCYVSLEERMGCGVGACLVCTCKIGQGENWRHQRVCADGPVFDIAEVDFDG